MTRLFAYLPLAILIGGSVFLALSPIYHALLHYFGI